MSAVAIAQTGHAASKVCLNTEFPGFFSERSNQNAHKKRRLQGRFEQQRRYHLSH
jgi:hypothetical protein